MHESAYFRRSLCTVRFALASAELLELQLRRAFRHADLGAVVPLVALGALKPDVFSLAFFLAIMLSNQPADREAGLTVLL